MEILAPAGTPSALKTAVDAGADAVYCGFRNETNARNFPGLNFSKRELSESIKYANSKNAKVLVAINTYPSINKESIWHQAIDDAAEAGVYAIIVADIGLLDYAQKNHPNLKTHLSVQASASTTEAINYYQENFNISRVVLPRVMSINQIKEITQKCHVETEVFVFGGLCVMSEGRCSLSSYVTGLSPNKDGVCSPAHHVEYETQDNKVISKLSQSTINIFQEHENPGYPTICKGRFIANGKPSYLFEEPTSLSIINMLKELKESGVSSLKIEGRQRGKAYIANITRAFREAIDNLDKGLTYNPQELIALTEGNTYTSGAYKKGWK